MSQIIARVSFTFANGATGALGGGQPLPAPRLRPWVWHAAVARPAGPAPTMRTTVSSSIGNERASEVLLLEGDVNVGLEELLLLFV